MILLPPCGSSQCGLCALTRLSHGDLKAGKTRHKTHISRRRQRDPNYCSVLTCAVIPSLSSKDKKADSPEPKCMFPAVLELQQRCGCVCLQFNNTPEDSFVFNTMKYQHNQCFSPLALWNSSKSALIPKFPVWSAAQSQCLEKQVPKLLLFCPFIPFLQI